MKSIHQLSKAITLIFVIAAMAAIVNAQGVKRVVVIKIDGLPAYYVDQFVRKTDPATGRSVLPWIDEIFYKNGTRIPNFYTRGASLSGPSWGQIDTGQHLQIKGNVEYDRYTRKAYDYLNFIPYYIDYGLSKKVDMPAVEVMDQLHIPVLADAFPFDNRYTGAQLYQRGNDWAVLASGFVNLYPGNPSDMIDEWTIGLDFRKVTIDQSERDILGKLVKRSHINYFDYYDTSFDHISHHNNDDQSRLVGLKELDRLLGRFWVAIQSSSRADETAIALISDHGVNSEDGIMSQGFNIVKLLASAQGGGHHVITKRRLMLDYSIKGLFPLVPLITTTSKESYYLKGQGDKYPTALVDFDGNERSSLHLRQQDLNILQILLQQLQKAKLTEAQRSAVEDAFFDVIDRNRATWQSTVDGLDDEMGALQRWVDGQDSIISTLLMKGTKEQPLSRSEGEKNRRVVALTELGRKNIAEYSSYTVSLKNLLALRREFFDAKRLKVEDLIAPGAMGEPNRLYDLQNYVIGLSPAGVVLNADNDLDIERSFSRVDYLRLLHDQRVRNNVQAEVSSRPVDFVGIRIPAESLIDALPADSKITEDACWLYAGPEHQLLVLSRTDENGVASYKHLPIKDLRQRVDGKVTFDQAEVSPKTPLKYFADDNFDVPVAERKSWLSQWHTEIEWMRAIHRTKYSVAIIGINEQLDRHPVFDPEEKVTSGDELLIRQFRQRQRHLTEADLLIMANDHWNFDVRGFNPGGNHGSFFRVSTNSTFMIAGGSKTSIPRGLAVEEPYDSLSFVPTILSLMEKVDVDRRPNAELKKRGFKRFPGRVIKELFYNSSSATDGN